MTDLISSQLAGSISAQLASLSTPGSMVTEAMTMTYDPAEPRGAEGEWIDAGAPSFIHEYETMGSTGYITKRKIIHGPFYHGGRAKLGPGDLITPGRKANPWGDEFDSRGRSIHTYFATEPSTAVSYARQSNGQMYEVEPTGESKSDLGAGNYKTKHPLRVIRRIPQDEWDSLPSGGRTEDAPAQTETSNTGLLSTDLASDITYESTEATLSQIRTQLDHAVSGDAVAAITELADTLPAALPDDPETVGHVADGQTALAEAQAALRRAVDAAQAALRSHELNNGPAHEAAQSAGGVPEREYVTGGLAGQIELAFNPGQPRDHRGRWTAAPEWDPFEQTLDEYRESQEPEHLAPSETAEYWNPAHLYHGTSAKLNPGDMVTPGHGGPNYGNTLDKRQSHAYATPHVSQAVESAHNSVLQRGGQHHVYEVERAADMMPDPESGYGIGGPESMREPGWRSPTGFRVIRELPSPQVRAAADEAGIDMASTGLLSVELAFNPAEPRGKGGEWVTMYHGTSKQNAEAIAKGGLDAPEGHWYPAQWPITTVNRQTADAYATRGDEHATVELHIPADKMDEYFWPAQDHIGGAAYAPKKHIPAKWVAAVHSVTEPVNFPAETETSNPDHHLLTTDLAAWEHEA